MSVILSVRTDLLLSKASILCASLLPANKRVTSYSHAVYMIGTLACSFLVRLTPSFLNSNMTLALAPRLYNNQTILPSDRSRVYLSVSWLSTIVLLHVLKVLSVLQSV